MAAKKLARAEENHIAAKLLIESHKYIVTLFIFFTIYYFITCEIINPFRNY
jgi:hypothetical protein